MSPTRSGRPAAKRAAAPAPVRPTETRYPTRRDVVETRPLPAGQVVGQGMRSGGPVYRPSWSGHSGPLPQSRPLPATGTPLMPTQYYTRVRTCTGVPSEALVSRTFGSMSLGVDTLGTDAEGTEMPSPSLGSFDPGLESDDVRNHVAARERAGTTGSATSRRVLFASPPEQDSAVSVHTPPRDEDTFVVSNPGSPELRDGRHGPLPAGVRSLTVDAEDRYWSSSWMGCRRRYQRG